MGQWMHRYEEGWEANVSPHPPQYTSDFTLSYSWLIFALLDHNFLFQTFKSLSCFITQGLTLLLWKFAQCLQGTLTWWKINAVATSNKTGIPNKYTCFSIPWLVNLEMCSTWFLRNLYKIKFQLSTVVTC